VQLEFGTLLSDQMQVTATTNIILNLLCDGLRDALDPRSGEMSPSAIGMLE
jgi:ABC-type dipeptide/oligopeptide/nickel transport system permease subunit